MIAIMPFRNRKRVAFFSLFISLLTILIISLLLFYFYLTADRSHLTYDQAKKNIHRLVILAAQIPNSDLDTVIHFQDQDWLHIRIRPDLSDGISTVAAGDTNGLDTLLQTQERHINMAIPLQDNQYLLIQGHHPINMWRNMGFFIAALGIVGLLLIFCFTVVRYLNVPFKQFAKAAERFGRDLQPAPIAEQGPEDVVQVAKAFNSMQRQIRRLLDDRTHMLAAISHDLRTPITRLKLRAEMMSDEKQYEKIVADLDEMEQMINSIMRFARYSLDDEERQTFNMTVLVESICSDMVDMGKDVKFDENAVSVSFNGRMLAIKRAIQNIIENAIKYGQSCEVSLAMDKDYINIIVQDHGPGIAEEHKERVFDPFYRVNNARTPTIPGTGLGLTSARDIIRSQSGEIELHNRNGLQVIIKLPIDTSLGNATVTK